MKPEEQMITAFPDVMVIQNKNLDFIIMGCDGIWDKLNNEEVISLIWKELKYYNINLSNIEKLERVVNKVLIESMKKASFDNITIILIVFNKLII